MTKTKTIIVLFGLVLSTLFGSANCLQKCIEDNTPISIIKTSGQSGVDRSSSIAASINDHYLTINFLTDIGHVWIKVTDGKMALSYTIHDDSYVEVIIYSVFGNTIKQINLGKQDGGSQSIDLDLSDIPDGMYLCSLKTDGKNQETVKIIITH